MRHSNVSIGIVSKTAKILARHSNASLSQCREIVSKAIGYGDYFDLSRNGTMEREWQGRPENQLAEAEINTTAEISRQLGISPVTAHHVLANTLFHRGSSSNMGHALAVVTKVFERTILPPKGWRQPGQIGKLKSPGRNGEHVILREFARATRVITHKSAVALVADFEYIGPRGFLPLFIPMRLYVPYGVWTEKDGSRVLFSRDYFPMWRLREGRTPERLNPWKRIDYVEQNWLLSEEKMPWQNSNYFDVCIRFLESEGVRSFPLLVDALPLLVNDPTVRKFSDVANALETKASGKING